MALICHCEVVSERAIRKAIRHGACSLDDVAQLCGAGSRCGGCVPAIEDVLECHLEARAPLTRRYAT